MSSPYRLSPKIETRVMREHIRAERAANQVAAASPEANQTGSLPQLAPGQSLPPAAPQLPPLFGETFERLAAAAPDKVLLIFDGPLTRSRGVAPPTFTASELNERCNRLVRAMREQYGVGCGDRVVTVCDNRPEMFTLMLACLKIGAALTPLATDLMTEHEHLLTDTYAPKMVVNGFPGRVFPHPEGGEWPTITLPPYYDHYGGQFDRMETEGDSSNPEHTATYEGTGLIFSTSGSTGIPKGVMYSGLFLAIHGVVVKMMAAKGQNLLRSSESNPNAEQKQLLWVPMRGVGGTSITLMLLAEGVVSVMCDSASAGPAEWAPLIHDHSITTVLLFGAAMNRFVSETPAEKFPSITQVTYGGNAFPPTLIQQSMEQFPDAHWTQGYAMTEVMMMSTLPNPFHKRAGECNERDLMIMRSAGKPAPGLSEIYIEPIDNQLVRGSGAGD